MMGKRYGNVLLFAAVLVAAWEYGVPNMGIPPYVLPTPSAIFRRFAETAGSQVYHLSMTALTTLIGLALGIVVGVLLALAALYVPLFRSVLVPAFAAFNGIPKVAIAPLLIVWFGLGPESKVLIAFLLAVYPIFVNAFTGLSEIEADLLDLGRLTSRGELRIFLKIRLPHALPNIMDAIKVAFPLALVGAVVGEFIAGNRGIGYLILSGQFQYDTALVFAGLLSITLFTGAGIALIGLVEALLFAWRPSRRSR